MSLLLEVDTPGYEEARNDIAPFAEIVKCPEHVHTYKITPLSLWNAASAGFAAPEVVDRLRRHSRFEVPERIASAVSDLMARYGRVRLLPLDETRHQLVFDDERLRRRLTAAEELAGMLDETLGPREVSVKPLNRGLLKQAFIRAGYPVQDLAGYKTGEPLEIRLQEDEGAGFTLRPYQAAARDAFYRGGTPTGGSGVVTLPCGSGKTIVGMAAMALVRSHTLVLNTSLTAIRQWKRELLDKTDLDELAIGEYSGAAKEIRPVTLTDYQVLSRRRRGADGGWDFPHFNELNRRPWGLVIYDEVHLLPANVFRFTASLQAVRRLGLTATLVREDGREADVFSLIGPKCYDVPWKIVEAQGWIAQAACFEVKADADESTRVRYESAGPRDRFRIAAENPAKIPIVRRIVSRHPDEKILIIGQYLDQMKTVAGEFRAPLVTGETPQAKRDETYRRFRDGDLGLLVVSSVANFALDLPDASVAIQISGKFGSRQEEAQRLGRILRPKKDGRQASFYTVVSRNTEEEDFAIRRQMFLAEEGYSYGIFRASEI